MRIPLATYRLQFGPSLGFRDARALVPYLAELGISDLYASPILKATPGSTHGYDVTDPGELNPELGSPEDFQALVAAVQAHGMGWLQDIVPNHMAYSSENRMLMDVLENGLRSRFYDFFDIFHDHPDPELRTRVLAPFLRSPLEEILRRGELQLILDDDGLAIQYFTWRFPLCLGSYAEVLGHGDRMSGSQAGDDPGTRAFGALRESFARLSETADSAEKRTQVAQAKKTLAQLHREHPMIRLYLDGALESHNQPPADPIERSPLYRLLERQVFKLAFWQVAYETINYRRFFYLSEFIALCVENPRVFQAMHHKTLELVRAGVFTGLRIDHIDGLYNPRRYLLRLQQEAPETYLVVEKILELYEFLRTEWPIQGTSGYKFCNYVNGLFCRQENEAAFTDLYHEFLGAPVDYGQLLYNEKRKILEQRMAGEVKYLAYLVLQAAVTEGPEPQPRGPDPASAVARALTALIAVFPVYRTYADTRHFTPQDRAVLTRAAREAAERCPECRADLDLLLALLLSALPERVTESDHPTVRPKEHLLMRFQQFTGPAMAKGFEDTVLYIYNRFLALNEVGGDPGTFGLSLQEFHRFLRLRARDWPHVMNATSTHDSKRGEDVRARLNVLSEIPDRWRAAVIRWAAINEHHKESCDTAPAPDRNDEYLMYQTLVGAWPFELTGDSLRASGPGDDSLLDEFTQRIKDYVLKAIREAKTHTNWVEPDEPYESACLHFIERVLDPSDQNPFWLDFLPFQKQVSMYGVYNSLAQTTLKLTCTGLPDFYQGAELWDLNLVDPDNRRPVDFGKRKKMLERVSRMDFSRYGSQDFTQAEWAEAQANPASVFHDAWAKLFLIHRGLRARRENRDIFDAGDHLPATVTGNHAEHIVAFFRSQGPQRWALVVVPRFLTSLIQSDKVPLGERVWGETSIVLPPEVPTIWHNTLTGETLHARGKILVAEILARFPTALLLSRHGE